MSNADRIEELRKKYEENPRRYFAPLANEFRKAGDLTQAIAICREHLPKQPGHMSGYIVFGQTLFEANSLDEARTVFEQALTLDPENLIALKHLGDIARMKGENSIARRWYARVLDADPRNDDIASQLASLGTPTPVTPAAVIPPPAPEPEPLIDGKPGVFATFDPTSLIDVPGAAESIVPASPERIAEPSFADQVESSHRHAVSDETLPDLDELALDIPVTVPPAPVAPPRPASSTPLHAIQIVPPAGEVDSAMEPLDLDFPDSPVPASEEFEEGILAPEWPDTTELVNRVQTPIRSATPLSAEVIPPSPEAVAAFGREHGDPVDPAPADLPVADDLVEAFLPPDHLPGNAAESAGDFVAELETAEFSSAGFDASAAEPLDLETAAGEVAEEIPVTAQMETEPLIELNEIPMPWDVAAGSGEPMSSATIDLATADTGEITVPPAAQEFSEGAVAEADSVVVDTTEVAAVEMVAADASETLPMPDTPLDSQVTAEFPIAGDWSVPVETTEVSQTVASLDAQFASADFVDDLALEAAVEAGGERWEARHIEETVDSPVHTFDADLEVDRVAALPDAPSAELSFADVSSEVASEVAGDVSSEVTSEVASDAEAARVMPEASHDESVEEEEAPTFVTETMAELLLSQGHLSRAIEVYDELVRRRPTDPVLAARLAELRESERAELAQAELLRAELHRAELERVARLSAEPSSMPTPAVAVHAITPLYSTPHSGIPHGGLRGTPSFAQQVSVSGSFAAQSGMQQGRTARERFAELAARRVARRTPSHATAIPGDQSEGLSTLFGTSQPATTDELAARALAEAFGPVEDSGESLFDPAPMPTPVVPLRALTPRSVAPVSAPAHPGSEQRAVRQPSSDYSFDKFFPDPAMTPRDAQPAHSPASTAQDPSQPVNEDLAQFSAWLKGLNNA